MLIAAILLAAQIFSAPVDLSVPKSPTAVRAGGVQHLLYELHLTNFGSRERALRKVTILDDASGRELASYDGAALDAALMRPGSPALSDNKLIAGGMRAVVFLEVALPGVVPRTLRHRVVFGTADAPEVVEGAVTPVTPRATLIASPLRGERWLAMHGLSNASTHRRTIVVVNGQARIAQRFATDWTRIGANGLAFHDDPAKLSDWYAYGAPVLAVADGRVVQTGDGIPENDPTADKKAVEITLETVGGNYVLLDLGQQRFAFYAHLQPGSIKVKTGDRVARGQELALLGNSGNSDAPHLHFHLVDGPSPLGAEGIPYELPDFRVLGGVASLQSVAVGAGWKPTAPPQARHHEMPAENEVVTFP